MSRLRKHHVKSRKRPQIAFETSDITKGDWDQEKYTIAFSLVRKWENSTSGLEPGSLAPQNGRP